jgi:TRAP-type mannitol/chloroaromatic compound transport system permease small subunit
MKTFLRLFSVINKVNVSIGKTVSLLVFPMILTMLIEVVGRYVFNRPTLWAHETSSMIYAVYFLMGGAYTLQMGGHVHVDTIYRRFPVRVRAVIDLFTWLMFYLFCGTLLWKGILFSWESVIQFEHSSSTWGPPIWPFKLFIPLSAFFMILQGTVKTCCDLINIFFGEEKKSDISFN